MISQAARDNDALIREWFRMHFGERLGYGTVVAVVDSGWNSQLDDSAVQPGLVIQSLDTGIVASDESSGRDRIGHGTACILLIREIAPAATVLPIKVFDTALKTSAGSVTAAVSAAVAHGADVINLSLSTRSRIGMIELYNACEVAVDAGTIVVASSDADQGGFPSTFDNVIGVAGASLPARLAYQKSPVTSLDFAANL